MKSRNNASGETHMTITTAVGHLLRPLVRLLLSNGISFQVFCELVKSAYVKVADEEFRLPSKPQTDSRISLLTGLHRREVNRFRNEAVAEINLSQDASMSALLLTIWSGHAKYLDQNGMPIPLARLSSKGEKLSFDGLVQSVSKDFRPRVVLDEWLRQGIVTLDSDDNVHLAIDAFAQPQDIEEKYFYFGQNLHDHLAATTHNLIGGQPPFLERCIFYDKLSAESSKALAEYSKTVGMKALHAVNKRAAELQKRDQDQQHTTYRANFGVYYFSEPETPNENKAN